MTQSGLMRRIPAALAGLLLALGWPASAWPGGQEQASDEPVTVSSEHPRLFLRPARLRLLKRERERASARWQQFDALLAGNASMPEPGLALALDYQVSGNAAAGQPAASSSPVRAAGILLISPDCVIATHRLPTSPPTPARPLPQII